MLIDLTQNCINIFQYISQNLFWIQMTFRFSSILYPLIQSSTLFSCLFANLEEGVVSMLYQDPKSARACAVIKTTSKSITVQPLRLLPSRRCKGIFLPGNCGGWLQLVPGAKRGVRGGAVQADWIFCRVGELHKVLSPSGDFFWHLSYSAPLNTGCRGWQPAQVQVSRGTLLHRSQSSFTDWTQAAELEEEDRMKVEREGVVGGGGW